MTIRPSVLAIALSVGSIGAAASAQGSPWGAPPPLPPGYATQAPVYAAPGYAAPVYAAPMYVGRPQRVPYEGGPVPQGMHIEQRARTGLVVGGAVTFGVTYLVTAFVGGVAATLGDWGSGGSSPAWWLVAPVFGPIAFGASVRLDGSAWAFLVLDSLAQAGGLTMLIYGATQRAPYLVPNGMAAAPAQHRPRWTLLPGTGTTPYGASFALRF